MYCLARVYRFIWANLELSFWVSAMIFLFFLEPAAGHFTLCPISNLGFNFCPGCGLGHSIHYALRLNIGESFSHHPLGIIAVVIIFSRIIKLVINLLKSNHYEHKTFTPDTRC